MQNRIRDLRESRRMTQVELAKRAGISRATLSTIENETGKNTLTRTLDAIAEALGCEVTDLILR